MTMTPTNTLREQLLAFTFTRVFQSRGWNAPVRRPFILTVREREVTCTPIADQGGWTVLEITATGDGPEITAPGERAWREMVDKAVTDQIHHHILIFINPARTEALWQFSATISGKRLRRERRLNAGTPIAPLVALLRGMEIPFEMLDDDGEVSVTAMNDRMAQIGLYAERVSKRFYDLLAKKRKGFELFLAWVDAEKDRSWYITALLNRLMFVYFIQHKGLMQGDQAYLRHRLTDCIEQERNFYREFFLPLCFCGFARPWADRGKFETQFKGIPYLNGGLFYPHKVELDHNITPEAVEAGKLPAEITIPNEQFVAWFDFFDSYRWTLDEDNVELEGHINPDILGYIFEKYINQKQMGAYYTKEDITGYICRNTVISRLFDMLAATGKKGILAVSPLPIGPHPNILNDGKGISGGEGIERYIYPVVKTQKYLPTETDREYLARQQRYEAIRQDFEDGKITAINDIITYNLDIEQLALDFIAGIQDAEVLRDFYFEGLRKITVLDPTCGSGAFLFAALKVLYPLYAACVKKMEEFHQREAGDAAVAVTWKGEFAFANEVSQQLGFIDTPNDGRQAILDLFGSELTSIRKHDNVEYFIYKRIIVDNLFGVDIMAEAVEICKLRLFLKLIAHAEPVANKDNLGIEPLPDVDFNILCGNTLVGFGSRADVDAHFSNALGLQFAEQVILDRLIPKLERFAMATMAGQHDEALKTEIEELKTAVSGSLTKEEMGRHRWKKGKEVFEDTHQPFHWLVEFPRVLANGGFDVIIGNPPYVEYSKVRSQYSIQGYSTEDSGNLFAFVVERSFRVSNNEGRVGMILPLAATTTDRTASFRQLVGSSTYNVWHASFGFRPAKLFDGVNLRLSIILTKNGRDLGRHLLSSKYILWSQEERPNLLDRLSYVCAEQNGFPSFPKFGDVRAASVAGRLVCMEEILGNWLTPNGCALLHYHRSPLYWIRAMDFEPHFKSAERDRSVHHFRDLAFDSHLTASAAGAILNSSLFYWWFVTIGNCRNLTAEDVRGLPVGIPTEKTMQQLGTLFTKLMDDYRRNSELTVRYNCEYQTFYPSKSKPIIDEIDRMLAQHYGFTDEELDFIINYDIKYRMGRDAEGDDDE